MISQLISVGCVMISVDHISIESKNMVVVEFQSAADQVADTISNVSSAMILWIIASSTRTPKIPQ